MDKLTLIITRKGNNQFNKRKRLLNCIGRKCTIHERDLACWVPFFVLWTNLINKVSVISK